MLERAVKRIPFEFAEFVCADDAGDTLPTILFGAAGIAAVASGEFRTSKPASSNFALVNSLAFREGSEIITRHLLGVASRIAWASSLTFCLTSAINRSASS